MTDHESGRIVSVESIPLGSELNGDHLAGVTSLTVNDAVDFDWDGGSLVIDGQVIAYTTFNDDTGVITLSEALAAAADDGTRVDVYDTYYGTASVEKIALVELDGDSYNTDSVTCTVANHLVDKLADGLRDTNGESVLIEIDSAEWRIIDLLGLGDPEATGTQFHQDTYTVVAAGAQSLGLTHEPIENSEHLYWNGLYQPGSEWSRDGRTVAVPDAGGVIAVDDVLTVEYAYRVGFGSSSYVVDVDWGASGWRYLQVALSDTADYSGAAFDDSAWAAAATAFGAGPNVPYAVSTAWAVDTSLWLRRSLSAGSNFVVEVLIEDNCTVYFNGVEVGTASHSASSGSTVDTMLTVEVPNEYANSDAANVLSIRCNDDVEVLGGDTTFADVRVRYTAGGSA